MPDPVIGGGIFEFQIRGMLDSQRVINTFHYVTLSGVADQTTTLDAAAVDFMTEVLSPLAQGMSNFVSFTSVRGQAVWPTRFVAKEYTPAPGGGQLMEDSIVSGGSMVVRRKSSFANRRGRGRIYVPGMPLSAVTNSVINNAWLALFETAITDGIKVSLPDGEFGQIHPVIWSPNTPTQFFRVIDGEIDPSIRYQRRREVGRGE